MQKLTKKYGLFTAICMVVGIVIGSVLVVGIGGGAVFWFVIKKKSFDELIALVKGFINKLISKIKKSAD